MTNAPTLTRLAAMVALPALTALAPLTPQAPLAQDKPTAAATKAELPSGESILDRFIEATGGKDAYKKVKNTVLKGSISFAAMGVTADVTLYKAEPNLMLTEVNIPGMGKTLDGFDGKNGWSYSAMMGPAVKTGKEAIDAKNNSEFREEEWRDRYSKAETIGVETVEGEECYKVLLSPKAGNPVTNFYSKKSGLLIRSDAKAVTPMGEIEGQVVSKDYRKVGGLILMPFQLVNSAAGQTMLMTFSEIKINADVPKSTFEPPAEVKALLGK